LIFKPETKKSIHTISGILENFKKPGLVKETLGKLGNLTPERFYHKNSGVKKYPAGDIFHISPSNFRFIVV
jgi:hypothetical protein